MIFLFSIVNPYDTVGGKMIKEYCYSRCSTCKKALKWLDDNKLGYELIDIKENNPDEETIRSLYERGEYPLKKFFNTSGILYREMGLSKKLKDMSEDEQIRLLSSDGMLIKRPLLISDKKILLGFKESEWEELKK